MIGSMSNPTFRERILEFWRWFPTVSEQVETAMQGSNPQEDLEFFIADVRPKLGGLSWVFGPGEAEDRLSFTATGEGQKVKQLLSRAWLENAVDIPNWDFYASRQPSPRDQLGNYAISVADQDVGTDSLMLAPSVNEENEQVDIKAWHPAFEQVDESGRFQILYLLLDEALGEFGTQTRLGEIEFSPFDDGLPLLKLPDFLDELWQEKGWQETSPLESNAVYKCEPSDDFCRADTFAGHTQLPHVVMSYLNNGGQLDEDPAEDSGAELLFVVIEGAGAEHHESALDYRNGIEDEISRLLAGGGGEVVGCAMGTQNSYVDIIIFDGERSRAAIKEAVDKMHSGSWTLKPFFVG